MLLSPFHRRTSHFVLCETEQVIQIRRHSRTDRKRKRHNVHTHACVQRPPPPPHAISNYNRRTHIDISRVRNLWVPRARIILKPHAAQQRRTNSAACSARRACTLAHSHTLSAALNRVTIKFQSACASATAIIHRARHKHGHWHTHT